MRAHPSSRLAVALACAALLAGGASCAALFGFEDWQDPESEKKSGDTATTSGAGGSGGSGGSGVGSSGGGNPSSVGAGGFDAACTACLSAQCTSDEENCQADPQCKKYLPCLAAPQSCCLAHELSSPSKATQAAYACLQTSCEEACSTSSPTCRDCFKNGSETDVDCGGDACLACGSGKACDNDADCEKLVCQAGRCQ